MHHIASRLLMSFLIYNLVLLKWEIASRIRQRFVIQGDAYVRRTIITDYDLRIRKRSISTALFLA